MTMREHYARIVGVGGYLPEKVVSNDELSRTVQTSDEWVRSRTGIRQRHIAADGQLASDLALPAAQDALAAAGIKPDELDMIIVATTTPDRIYPSTACLLQDKLGAAPGAAFDVQAVCSGFIYALSVADGFIATGSVKNILVVGAEVYSHILDWSDRNTCVLFGDGAGCAVLTASSAPGIVSAKISADGRYANELTVNAHISGGQLHGDPFTRMNGKVVYRTAVEQMTRAAAEVLDGETPQWVVLHQANERIIDAVINRLDIPAERALKTVAEQGNTSAASVPLALATHQSRFRAGDRLLLAAVGGGMTWGAVNLIW